MLLHLLHPSPKPEASPSHPAAPGEPRGRSRSSRVPIPGCGGRGAVAVATCVRRRGGRGCSARGWLPADRQRSLRRAMGSPEAALTQPPPHAAQARLSGPGLPGGDRLPRPPAPRSRMRRSPGSASRGPSERRASPRGRRDAVSPALARPHTRLGEGRRAPTPRGTTALAAPPGTPLCPFPGGIATGTADAEGGGRGSPALPCPT
ncbi:uncharacterized protein LOC121346701 [Onychostruthus taczanowskii]|uniref:uncharacterized protein LOC121346701 n=1 Tax=Onychostruthus taczanowskii TaxID=356909 RepID=UPI001B8012B5|nr:uncharacterized protein LOC121346701 [Onychostruthus taczanowskii]